MQSAMVVASNRTGVEMAARKRGKLSALKGDALHGSNQCSLPALFSSSSSSDGSFDVNDVFSTSSEDAAEQMQ